MDFIKAEQGINEVIGFNLNSLRAKRKINQRYAADRLGMSVSQLKKYESGKDALKLDTAVQSGILYGVPSWRLLKGTIYGPMDSSNGLEHDTIDLLERLSLAVINLATPHYYKLLRILDVTFNLSLSPKISDTSYTNLIDARPQSINLNAPNHRKGFFLQIGRDVKKLREAKSLSQQQVADGVNISVSAYRNYEDLSKGTRFGFVVGARYAAYAKVNPGQFVENSFLGKARKIHDTRREHMLKLIQAIGDGDIEFLEKYVLTLVDMLDNNKPVRTN